MDKQLSLSTNAQIPFVFLRDMPQETEDLGDDSLVKWSQVWHNSGGSKPLDLEIWGDCPDAVATEPLDFDSSSIPPTKLVLGPQTERTVGGVAKRPTNFSNNLTMKTLQEPRRCGISSEKPS